MRLTEEERERRRQVMRTMNRSRKGQPAQLTDSGRQRIRETTIARNHARKGLPISERAHQVLIKRAKLREGKKQGKHNFSAAGMALLIKSNKTRPVTERERAARRENALKNFCTPLMKELSSLRSKTKRRRKISRQNALDVRKRFPHETRIEQKIRQLLLSWGVEFEQEARIDKYCVDFLIPTQGLIIECDGDYWHSLAGRRERDLKRDGDLIQLGYKILHFRELEILKEWENVTQKLYSALFKET